MRRLLIIAMLCVSALSWAGTCGNGYSYSKAVTLTYTLVSTSDQTNYPWVMKGTYPAWATVANSGKIQNTAANTPGVTSPADFIICDASSSGNAIKFYFKYYDATSGKHVIWVQRATASHTVNATVYVFYGNVSVVTSQQDTSLLTDAGYVVSEDFPDGTTINVTDFSGTQTMTNHSATATAGPIDGAAKTVAASSQYVSAGTPVNPGASISIETLQYLDSYQPCNVITDNTNMIGSAGYLLFWGQPGCPSNEALFFIACPNAGCGSLTGKYTGLNLGSSKNWSYVGATMTSTGAANMHIYWDGTEPATTTSGSGGGVGTSAVNLSIGRASNNTNFFDGRNGTFRVSSVVHSKDWHDTNWNTWSGRCSTYQIVETAPPFSVTQYCGNIAASGVSENIVMPFNVTSGNWLVAGVADNGNCNTGTKPSDTQASVWTKQIGTVTGAKGVCWFTAPITSSGADTITYANGGQVMVYEVQGKPVTLAVDTTGTATVTATSITSSSMTVAQNNSLMFCNSQINSTNVAYTGFSPSSQNFQYGLFNSENPYPAASMTFGVVGSGANTCGFTMNSSVSTVLSSLIIKGSDTPQTTKRRMSQIY